MGQWVNLFSKPKMIIKEAQWKQYFLVKWIKPETKRSSHKQIEDFF